MGDQNFMGGLLGGLGSSMQKQQELQMLQRLQDAQINLIKKQASHEEAKVRLETEKFATFKPIIEQALSGQGQAQPQPTAAPVVPPQAQAPQAPPPMWGPGSLPKQMAQGQMNNPLQPTGGQAPPLGGGPINIPGDPANNISVRQNNPFNLKYVGQEEATGAGTRGFAMFPTAEAGVQAGIKQIQLDQSRGLTFGQFAEKYAPAYENPTWAADVSKMLGISANTPINQIPTMKLAQAVAWRESQTKLPDISGQQSQQLSAQPPILPAQSQAGQVQEFQPVRTISQRDALNAAWKYFTGSDLKDEKYDYRVVNKDILVMKDGQLIRKIQGGPDISWHNLPNGGFIALDSKTQQPIASIPIPEMVKSAGQTQEGIKYNYWEPKGGGTGAGPMMGGAPAIPGGATVTEYPGNMLPGTLPESLRTKIGENNAIVDQLNILQATFRPEYVGARGVAGKASDALSGIPGAAEIGLGDPQRRTWNQIYNEMLGQKLHARGGSALTKQEIAYVMNTLPLIAHNPELFKSGIEAAKMLIMASNYELQAAHLTPDKVKFEKAAADLVNQYKTKFKPLMEQGLKAGPAPPGVPVQSQAPSNSGLSPAGQKYMQQRGF